MRPVRFWVETARWYQLPVLRKTDGKSISNGVRPRLIRFVLIYNLCGEEKQNSNDKTIKINKHFGLVVILYVFVVMILHFLHVKKHTLLKTRVYIVSFIFLNKNTNPAFSALAPGSRNSLWYQKQFSSLLLV